MSLDVTCVTWSDTASKTFEDKATKVKLAKFLHALFSLPVVVFIRQHEEGNQKTDVTAASG